MSTPILPQSLRMHLFLGWSMVQLSVGATLLEANRRPLALVAEWFTAAPPPDLDGLLALLRRSADVAVGEFTWRWEGFQLVCAEHGLDALLLLEAHRYVQLREWLTWIPEPLHPGVLRARAEKVEEWRQRFAEYWETAATVLPPPARVGGVGLA